MKAKKMEIYTKTTENKQYRCEFCKKDCIYVPADIKEGKPESIIVLCTVCLEAEKMPLKKLEDSLKQ